MIIACMGCIILVMIFLKIIIRHFHCHQLYIILNNVFVKIGLKWMTPNLNLSCLEVEPWKLNVILMKLLVMNLQFADLMYINKLLDIKLDQCLTLKNHISSKAQVAAHGNHNLRQLLKYQDLSSALKIANSFIVLHMDYANSLSVNIPTSSL